MRSVMTHQFAQVPTADIPRSTFNRSFGLKTTFNSGYLVPVLVDEALPGDTFNCRMSAFARLATPIVPFMDNMYMDVFFFSVPNRLLWSHWRNMNGQQANPGDSTSYTVPQVVSDASVGFANGTLADYFGLPTAVTSLSVSALPFRAYNLIYNEWFRDQNLQNSVNIDTGDGPDSYGDYTLLRRGKRHDYFTSCLPFAQKGTAVTVPIGSSANVYQGHADGSNTGDSIYFFPAGSNSSDLHRLGWSGAASNVVQWNNSTNLAGGNAIVAGGTQIGSSPSANQIGWADFTNATAATINQLRQSFQIQKLYERDARGGTRYTEVIRAHFGVTSPDARQQRPEYLGGGSFRVTINPIAQTGGTGASGTTTPQGNLAAYGTVAMGNGAGFTYSATEHCTILGLISVRADLTYQQCLDRMWSRQTRFDFYWPALSHIGEQSVLNKEIYCDNSSNDDLTFGYQERYAEYRYKNSLITGQFRSNYSAPLDMWHLSQHFTTLPVLNSTFIVENPPVSRVVAVPSAPQFLLDTYFQMKCARPMPVYSVPGLIDHF